MAFHSRRPVGEIMARATNDVREVNLMLNPGINLVVGSGMFLLVPILFAPRYHPSLVAVPAVFTVSYAWALRAYLRELAPITQEARTAFGRMNVRLTEAVDGIFVIPDGVTRWTLLFHNNFGINACTYSATISGFECQ